MLICREHKGMSSHPTVSVLPVIILGCVIWQSCGFIQSQYVPYPTRPQPPLSSHANCPIETAAFTFHIAPMLSDRCMSSCHVPGGNAGSVLVFSGTPSTDLNALKKREDGTAHGLFRKAAGIVPHGGGKAALDTDLDLFDKWFAAQALCKQPPK